MYQMYDFMLCILFTLYNRCYCLSSYTFKYKVLIIYIILQLIIVKLNIK